MARGTGTCGRRTLGPASRSAAKSLYDDVADPSEFPARKRGVEAAKIGIDFSLRLSGDGGAPGQNLEPASAETLLSDADFIWGATTVAIGVAGIVVTFMSGGLVAFATIGGAASLASTANGAAQLADTGMDHFGHTTTFFDNMEQTTAYTAGTWAVDLVGVYGAASTLRAPIRKLATSGGARGALRTVSEDILRSRTKALKYGVNALGLATSKTATTWIGTLAGGGKGGPGVQHRMDQLSRLERHLTDTVPHLADTPVQCMETLVQCPGWAEFDPKRLLQQLSAKGQA